MADYAKVLKNVDATSRTVGTASRNLNAKNIANLWFGLLVLVLLTLFTLFLVKKIVLNETGNLWDFLTKPYKNLIARLKAADAIEQTGQRATLATKADAAAVADSIYNCFQSWSDDETSLYHIIENNIANAADWTAVKGQFGVRTCPKPLSVIGVKHDGDLEHILSHNLSDKERTHVRNLLAGKGITHKQI